MQIISSNELVKEIKIGWNLGNSFDACKTGGMESETSWYNPKTTKELVDVVCKSGFNLIRLPVTWYNHFIDENYTIDEEWLKRVKTVVDYCNENGVFIVLNTHHENWFYTSEENYPKASKILKRIWEQLCEYFEEYDEHLIFEGLNEPRMNGTPDEWNGGTKEARTVINKLNKDFVDTVRASGGNNINRHLMLATYCGSCKPDVMSELEVPANDDKLIVTVHSYVPWVFAAKEDGDKEFRADDKEFLLELDGTFELMKKYCTDKNIPIIIGEFGAVNRDNLAERVKYINYMKKKSAEIGAKCIWWDNGNKPEFQIFDRKKCEPVFDEIIKALVE